MDETAQAQGGIARAKASDAIIRRSTFRISRIFKWSARDSVFNDNGWHELAFKGVLSGRRAPVRYDILGLGLGATSSGLFFAAKGTALL
jgi:hypothetical protein